MSCSDTNSPCSVTETNTAACESLPSQIQNFTDQFFGTVVKSEENNVVTWTLPCALDIGLDGNPRAEGEGLACYFLRLFSEGIVGLEGPQGEVGATGTDGHNAYTVTLQGFTQPTIGSPNVTVLTDYNPAIVAGLYIFISGSGHYLVNHVDGSGALSLTLTKVVDGVSGAVAAGKLVVPSGYPGASVVGPTGPQGPAGTTGSPGQSFTANNGSYYATVGVDYALPVVYAAVDFTNSSPQVLLSTAGVYLLTVTIGLLGQAGVVDADITAFKLRNTSAGSDVSGSEKSINFIADTQYDQLTISITVTTTLPAQTIALYGKCTTLGKVKAVALQTTIAAVRLS